MGLRTAMPQRRSLVTAWLTGTAFGLTALLGVAQAQQSGAVTDVTLDIWLKPGAPPRRYQLQCDPPRGTVPEPSLARDRIALLITPHGAGHPATPARPPVSPEPTPPPLPPRRTDPGISCTQVYSPSVARIRGVVGGIPVDRVFGGRDGCELSGFNATLDLLGIPR
jgi:hypothetical protein